VIIYLRRQDEWLESWYNQHIKWPWDPRFSTLSPQEFYAKRDEFYWLHYAETLRRWEAIFGKGSLIIRLFEESQLDGSIVNDFCSQCGIDFDALDTTVQKGNVSVAALPLMFLRHMSMLERAPAERWQIVSRVCRVFAAAGINDAKHVFSPRQKRQFALQFQKGNARIAREYLCRDNAHLFLNPLPDENESFTEPTLPPLPEMLDRIVCPLVRDFLEDITRLSEQGGAGKESVNDLFRLIHQRSQLIGCRSKAISTMSSGRALLDRLSSQILHSAWCPKRSDSLGTEKQESVLKISDDAPLFGSAEVLGNMLGLQELEEAERMILMDALMEWQAQNPLLSVEDRSSSAEVFIDKILRGLVDLLVRRLEATRRIAMMHESAIPDEIVRAEAHVLNLYAEVRDLEEKISTPTRTARELYRLMRGR
jgi:chorismate mutase